jgi:hypothetical protein
MRFPQGISGLGSVFTDYLGGWTNSSGVPVSHLLAALLVYQPAGLIFGFAAALRAWIKRIPVGRALSVWALVALLLALIYPSRQVSDLVWTLVPLWALAALEISRHLGWDDSEALTTLGHSGLVFLLLTFVWLGVAGLGHLQANTQIYYLNLAALVGVLILGIVATLLIGFGWSAKVARRGLVWGTLAFFCIWTLAAGWGATQDAQRIANELWVPGPVGGQKDLLVGTLGDLSEFETGERTSVDVVCQTDSASMRWALREFSNVRYTSRLEPGELPSIVITDANSEEPSLSSAYSGQSFSWQVYSNWDQTLGTNWNRWVLFRQAPTTISHVILWARVDVFPGGTMFPSAGEVVPSGGDLLEELVPGLDE